MTLHDDRVGSRTKRDSLGSDYYLKPRENESKLYYDERKKESYPVRNNYRLEAKPAYLLELANTVRAVKKHTPQEMEGAYGSVYPGYSHAPIRIADNLGKAEAEVKIHELLHVINPGDSEAKNRENTYNFCREAGIKTPLHSRLRIL